LDTNEDIAKGMTDIVTKIIPVFSFISDDGGLDFTENLNTINNKIFADMVGKAHW
jgi:hypothetical protein